MLEAGALDHALADRPGAIVADLVPCVACVVSVWCLCPAPRRSTLNAQRKSTCSRLGHFAMHALMALPPSGPVELSVRSAASVPHVFPHPPRLRAHSQSRHSGGWGTWPCPCQSPRHPRRRSCCLAPVASASHARPTRSSIPLRLTNSRPVHFAMPSPIALALSSVMWFPASPRYVSTRPTLPTPSAYS